MRANVFCFCLALSLKSVADDSIQLDEMTIIATPENYCVEDANTATRTHTSLLETPFSVGVISPELLNDSQVLISDS